MRVACILAVCLGCVRALSAEPSLAKADLDPALWAWFDSHEVNDEVGVYIIASSRSEASSIFKNWSSSKDTELDLKGVPLGSPEAKKIVRAAEYGQDIWCPPNWSSKAYVSRVLASAYRHKETENTISPTAFFVPCQDPPDRGQIAHLGAGKSLLAGDRSAWSFWAGSRLFPMTKEAWIFIGADAHAYIIAAPPKRYEISPKAGNVRMPMRLGGNPIILGSDKEVLPRLVSAAFFRSKVFVSTDTGEAAVVEASEVPKWTSKQWPFQNRHVRFVSSNKKLCAFTRANRTDVWDCYSSDDSERWELQGTAKIPADAIPVFLGERFLCTSSEGFTKEYTIWQRDDKSGEWLPVSRIKIPPDEIGIDFAEGNRRIYLLTGVQNKDGSLALRVRLYNPAPDTGARPAVDSEPTAFVEAHEVVDLKTPNKAERGSE